MKIDLSYFFLTLFLGIFIVYVTAPKPRVVIKNPTPSNAGKITYVDDNGVCYKYQKKEIMCPLDPTVHVVGFK